MNTIYNTGSNIWEHGQITERLPNGNPRRSLLGPCPHCGSVTFKYGGGFGCGDYYCRNSPSMFVCSTPDKEPDWWNKGIQVIKDGNAWCAHRDGFINLQESHAGFGDTPSLAVIEMLTTEPKGNTYAR